MEKKMEVGNICHIKTIIEFSFLLFSCLFFLPDGAAQNDSLLIYRNSKILHRYLATNYNTKDTSRCFLISFNKKNNQIKISYIYKFSLGIFCNKEYSLDSLIGISIEGKCFCFLFGDKSSLFYKQKSHMSLPIFFNEQLKYVEHCYLNLHSDTPPIFARFFVDCLIRKNNKLILLFKKELSVNNDYYQWIKE